MPKPVRIAVLVSGGGSNLEAILSAQKEGRLSGQVVLVVSSKEGVYALARAKNHGVESVVVERKSYSSENEFQSALLSRLEKAHVNVLCLAGYLRKISPEIIARYRGRILNIHPSLLPKYGGPGMYGHFVHEAVLKAGEKESGCTVHLVDEEFDHGPVLSQARVPVEPNDTPEVLAERILQQEHQLYAKTIREFCEKVGVE